MSKRIAVLIDADNTESKLLQMAFKEISKYGNVSIKRVFGDFCSPHINTHLWKEQINKLGLLPVHTGSYVVGKNTSDICLTVSAMEILYEKLVDGFAIISSDSDFTRVVLKLREQNMLTLGIGKRTAPYALQNAYDTFIHTESFQEPEPVSELTVDLSQLIDKAFEISDKVNEKVNLGVFGQSIKSLYQYFTPDFYGCQTIKSLIEKYFANKYTIITVNSTAFIKKR